MPIAKEHVGIGVPAIGEVVIRLLHCGFVAFCEVTTLTMAFTPRLRCSLATRLRIRPRTLLSAPVCVSSAKAKTKTAHFVRHIVGINHTIVDFEKRPSNQKDCNSYYHIQALADGLGLIVYCTASSKIAKLLDTKTRADIPIRNVTIVHDWSGYYYDGTVYTDKEEEEMIKKQYNID